MLLFLAAVCCAATADAGERRIASPDGRLEVVVSDEGGRASYSVTSDVFALATAVMFQSPVQHFAMAPNNLQDAPAWAVDFMKRVPTTWDDVKFIDGYPGRYVIMARRHGDTWYVVGINAQEETLKTEVDLAALGLEGEVAMYEDNDRLEGSVRQAKVGRHGKVTVTIPQNGAVVITNK